MAQWKSKDPKPRVNMCWECGNRLYGRQHVEAYVEGHTRILHKSCYQTLTSPTRREHGLFPLVAVPVRHRML